MYALLVMRSNEINFIYSVYVNYVCLVLVVIHKALYFTSIELGLISGVSELKLPRI